MNAFKHLPSLLLICTLGAGLVLSGCCGSSTPPDPDEANKAVAATEKWLALVDAQKYDESHDEAAAYFRSAVTKEAWTRQIEGVRKPLGELKSRSVKSTDYRTSLPGAPDGEYIIIQFETSYDNKANAIETVTPMKEKDGSWRVSGYYIK